MTTFNASIQENVSAIRVVKAYVREDLSRRNSRKPQAISIRCS